MYHFQRFLLMTTWWIKLIESKWIFEASRIKCVTPDILILNGICCGDFHNRQAYQIQSRVAIQEFTFIFLCKQPVVFLYSLSDVGGESLFMISSVRHWKWGILHISSWHYLSLFLDVYTLLLQSVHFVYVLAASPSKSQYFSHPFSFSDRRVTLSRESWWPQTISSIITVPVLWAPMDIRQNSAQWQICHRV